MRGVGRRDLSWALPALLGGFALLAASASALPIDPEEVSRDVGAALEDPKGTAEDPSKVVDPLPDEPGAPVEPPTEDDPGFADWIGAAFRNGIVVAGLAGLGAAALGMTALALVGRYVDPKEALENPQRSMLYGFVRGNPGVHLKKLGDEFAMKTSSILWHMRKLEGAQLVRSERANGYRVFYPVEGGMQAKQVSRAIANLRNGNARHLFEAIERNPGRTAMDLVRELGLHGGTARWHLRRMRDAGLLEELQATAGSRIFPTDLGRRALMSVDGTPKPALPSPTTAARSGLNASTVDG